MIASMAARLNAHGTLDGAIRTVLKDTIALVAADFGNIQLATSDQELLIVDQHGFSPYFLVSLRRLTKDAATACTWALGSRKPIVIRDVEDDEQFRPYCGIADQAGFSAVQSTPLLTRSGQCIAVLSTHFARVHEPAAVEMAMLNSYSTIAAERIHALLGPEPVETQADVLFERMLNRGSRDCASTREPRLRTAASSPERG
jgi:GAF domain-containing protein